MLSSFFHQIWTAGRLKDAHLVQVNLKNNQGVIIERSSDFGKWTEKKGVEALETLKQYPTIRSSDICINVIWRDVLQRYSINFRVYLAFEKPSLKRHSEVKSLEIYCQNVLSTLSFSDFQKLLLLRQPWLFAVIHHYHCCWQHY